MIRLKPHHILCSLCFQGKGYSPEFVENFMELVENLGKNPDVQITFQADNICMPCPHRVKQSCEKQADITQLDQAHANLLGLKDGEVLSWSECVSKAKDKITLKKFHTICEGCGWKKLGICEKVVKEFQSE